MCRLAGIFDPAFQKSAPRYIVMRDAMQRGGPDDSGYYIDDELPFALGHRRLSIIDLSAAGHQPMSDLDEKLQLIFNGRSTITWS